MPTAPPTLKRNSEASSWDQLISFDSAPYPVGSRSSMSNISPQYSFPPDPRDWGSSLLTDITESDDEQHTPSKGRLLEDTLKHSISYRGIGNVGCLSVLLASIITLFIAYPVITYYGPNRSPESSLNFGANATGQIPQIAGNHGLIDEDTPREAYTRKSWRDDSTDMQLVFSDEFNADGRSFYPGDDPYWEALDLHYWQTNNLEWYDPGAITTQNGSLVITLSKKQTHGLNYEGGMLTSWNKFCFTGGYLETSVELPGANNILGLWPAIWTLGNLGRAGYGASLEGVWPYTYDSCDVGTVANQTINGQPAAATTNGDQSKGGILSFLPGQRLSRCTCPGESHPGPKHSDGTFVGRSAPEIDVFEAQIDEQSLIPGVSQSAQWAPFDSGYHWNNTPANMVISNPDITKINTFVGSATQQATSLITETNPSCYENNGGCFSVYGFEYQPGFDKGYITWVSNNRQAWTLNAAGLGPDSNVQISTRPISQEPMYLIANLGMSRGFGPVDLANLPFPVHMRIDYIRVYQPRDAINIGCDPKDFPTQTYIDNYIEAYINPNLTTWTGDYQQPWPRNSFLGQC